MASNYEERMAEKYKFLKKESEEVKSKDPIDQNLINNESSSNPNKEIVSDGNLIVPLDAWNTVLNQLGNLHEANQLMAEARERAAKAEAESEFLREKLKTARQQLEEANKKKRFFFF
ncbi:MAG: hypothetical protein O3A48_01050 [Actinomycetota bacterium]|nr:hypothetical protein [Actinomycetota bacterium]MDA3013111.1 hypothetical protein [Actinomycetota bacterium]